MSECPLTPRQLDCLRLAALSNKQVARRLGIRLQTVKNHWTAIHRRLGTFNRAQAMILAQREGWLSAPDFEAGEARHEVEEY